MIGGNLGIYYNPSLVNLDGLNNLKHIGENLEIARNHALTSLHGLENLDTLAGSMSIGVNVPGFGGWYPIGNNALPNLNGLIIFAISGATFPFWPGHCKIQLDLTAFEALLDHSK